MAEGLLSSISAAGIKVYVHPTIGAGDMTIPTTFHGRKFNNVSNYFHVQSAGNSCVWNNSMEIIAHGIAPFTVWDSRIDPYLVGGGHMAKWK